MQSQILHIKNMVCDRCIKSVEHIFCESEIKHEKVRLGEVKVVGPISGEKLKQIEIALVKEGFELVTDKKSKQILQIKKLIIESVRNSAVGEKINLSSLITNNLNLDYPYLSRLFSEVEGKTIEQFYIQQKVERVKELVVYDELNFSEIAFNLGYSSVAHLSAQFKKITGLTLSHFKSIGNSKRKTLDSV